LSFLFFGSIVVLLCTWSLEIRSRFLLLLVVILFIGCH